MLLHWVAAGLVVGGTTCLGQILASGLRRRPDELQALQTSLRVLETEIDYGATPLPEALDRVARCSRGPARELFAAAAAMLGRGDGRGAGTAWAAALCRVEPGTAWSARDVEILLALGTCLGNSYREDQLRHLRLCQERLAAAEAEARDTAGRSARLAQYLGVLSGLALVLLVL